MRVSLVLVAALAMPLGACSFDLDSFSVASRDAAATDTGSRSDSTTTEDAPGTDGATKDAATKDTSPTIDTGGDGGDPIAAVCKAKGASAACFNCCGDGYPSGRAAVMKHSDMCVCGASVCASACDKTFCKAGASKTPDDLCAACLGAALDGSCSTEVDAARAEEPQVVSYLSCADACQPPK